MGRILNQLKISSYFSLCLSSFNFIPKQTLRAVRGHILRCYHNLIFLRFLFFFSAGGGGAHLFSVSSPLPPPIDCKFIIYCFFFSFLRLPTTVTFCPVLSCPLSVSLSNPQIDQEVNTVQINAIHNKKCDTSRVLLPNPAPHFPTRAPPVPAHGRN